VIHDELVARPCRSGRLLPTASLFLRHRPAISFRALDTWKALAGGLIVMIAYGVAVAAFSLGAGRSTRAASIMLII